MELIVLEKTREREIGEDVVVAAKHTAKISRVDCNKQFNGGYRILIVFNAQYTVGGDDPYNTF